MRRSAPIDVVIDVTVVVAVVVAVAIHLSVLLIASSANAVVGPIAGCSSLQNFGRSDM
jgi:hypothetical protein